jgi:hypothetical protein
MARRILWDRRRNPIRYVSQSLGLEERQLRDAIHAIKRRSGLSGTDRVIIYTDGAVESEGGKLLGNVHDEV